MRYNFFLFWASFCPFTLLTTWKIKTLKKWKKTPGYIIILHMCTANDDHMMYGSWDMEHHRQDFLSFWTSSCPFTPVTTQEIKIMKKWKKHLVILSFYKCEPEMKIMCGSWDMERKTEFFHILGHFFPFYPTNNWKIKIKKKKMKKLPGDIIILHKCTINDDHMMYGSWDMKCDRNNFCFFGPFFAILLL